MPVAVNCCVSPFGTLGLAGVIAIEVNWGVTSSVALVVTPSTAALIVELPFATPDASPCEPEVFEMVATEVAPDAQFTTVVKFWVVLSVNVPTTLNCSVPPTSINGSAGVIASDLSTAEPTVSAVEPVTPSIVALMVVVPCPTPVATPCDPDAPETVATEGALDDQLTWLVRFCVELSVNVPIAVNSSVAPFGTLELAGVTAIEARVTVAETTNGVPPSLTGAPG